MEKPCMLWDFDEFVVVFFNEKFVGEKIQMEHNNNTLKNQAFGPQFWIVSVKLKLPEFQDGKSFELLKEELHKHIS